MNRNTIDENIVTEEQLIEKGYRKYYGNDIDVYFNKDICTHSGKCVRGNRQVFEVGRKPWIIADNANAEDIIQIINTCPSGALKFILKNEKR